MTDLDAVLAADSTRTAAMVDRDLGALDALIADDCRYVHSTGVVDTKRSYLDKLADGTIGYTWITAADRTVVDLGSAILMSFVMEAELVLDGTARPYRSRAVTVWRDGDSGPRLVFFQATSAPH
jgi:Domain of unknown function (DUF4440)